MSWTAVARVTQEERYACEPIPFQEVKFGQQCLYSAASCRFIHTTQDMVLCTEFLQQQLRRRKLTNQFLIMLGHELSNKH
jgi:hypothetical protein